MKVVSLSLPGGLLLAPWVETKLRAEALAVGIPLSEFISGVLIAACAEDRFVGKDGSPPVGAIEFIRRAAAELRAERGG